MSFVCTIIHRFRFRRLNFGTFEGKVSNRCFSSFETNRRKHGIENDNVPLKLSVIDLIHEDPLKFTSVPIYNENDKFI